MHIITTVGDLVLQKNIGLLHFNVNEKNLYGTQHIKLIQNIGSKQCLSFLHCVL